MSTRRLGVVARGIIEMTKPKQLALLMITMYGAYFAATRGAWDPGVVALLFLTGVGSAGGVTALNMYIERDIDSKMERTRERPLPRGDLSPREALAGVVGLIALGTLAAGLINKWVMLTTLAGLYFDIIAYTELFKRHNALAMIAGSVAGSMPALGGWAAGAGRIGLPGLLLAGMVFVWQPLHVGFIHYAYREEYRAAGIPTLPDCLGYKGYVAFNAASIIGLITLVWVYYLVTSQGLLTALLASLMGVRALRAVRDFARSPSREAARRIVKLASPTLGIVFLMLPLEAAILGVTGA